MAVPIAAIAARSAVSAVARKRIFTVTKLADVIEKNMANVGKSLEQLQHGIGFDIDIDTRGMTKEMERIARKQIPFALMNTLNETAERVREAELEQIQEKLIVRNKWWTPKYRYGVNLYHAKKTKLEATVGTRAHFIFDDITGAIRSSSHRQLAPIGFPDDENVKRTSFGGVAAKFLPANIREEDKFEIKRPGKASILMGRGFDARRKTNALPIPLYTLVNSAKIRPVVMWDTVGAKTATKYFNRYFNKFMRQAIATSKG